MISQRWHIVIHNGVLNKNINYQVLDVAMHKAGFVGYENEWWDYRDSEMDNYGPAITDPNEYEITN